MKKAAKLVIMLGIALGVFFVLHIILLSVSEEYFKGWHAAKKDVAAWMQPKFRNTSLNRWHGVCFR